MKLHGGNVVFDHKYPTAGVECFIERTDSFEIFKKE